MRRYLVSLLAMALATVPTTVLATPAPETKESTQVDAQSKPRLGLLVMTISPELRTFFGSTNKSGVLVSRVEPGSPAARAGITVGDVLQEVGGTLVDDASDVPDALAKASKDPSVQIKLLRNQKPMTVDAKLTTTTSLLPFVPAEWLRQLFEQANNAKSA